MNDVILEQSPIPGLLVVRVPVHADNRGWFKENWQREKMTAVGVPDFGPVQNNISFNQRRGATRGLHAEPWDKLVSVATGRVFAAWVDLREGPSFGATHHVEIDPSVTVFVPRGVANGYQALEDATAYTYLVNEHWRPGLTYAALALDDPTAAVPWPIDLAEADISEKDRGNPRLEAASSVPTRRTLILGGHGQVGRAFAAEFPDAVSVDLDDLDLTDPAALDAWPWQDYDVVLNAAGYTAVDAAESDEGRRVSWAANATAPARLAALAAEHRFTLVHISTDYVFDGTVESHPEDEPLSPLGVYAQSKAAADVAVTACPRHYLLRSSWIVGEGKNFVRTMQRLARDGVSPSVVHDQVGRLTFATEIARATRHLLETESPFGTYNVTNAGPPTSWAEIARAVFTLCGRAEDDVTPITTEEYAASASVTPAPRPRHSVLDLTRLQATGFEPADAAIELRRYLHPRDPDSGT